MAARSLVLSTANVSVPAVDVATLSEVDSFDAAERVITAVAAAPEPPRPGPVDRRRLDSPPSAVICSRAAALVAQLDRASVFGTEGWGFEPLRVHFAGAAG